MLRRIDNILQGISIEEQYKVESIVEQYRERVRDAVKDAAMLSFGRRGKTRQQVYVKIESGAPDTTREALVSDDLGAALTSYRETFDKAAEALEHLPEIAKHLEASAAREFKNQWPDDASLETSRFLRELIRRIDEAGVIQEILIKTIDPLGSYKPGLKSGTIRIYWQMIALFAPQLGTTTEALTLKVLAHEYAHALSHLGMDADGTNWDIPKYWSADTYIHEGLANYWSWTAIKSSDDWLMREANRALESIWPRQPTPYSEFDLWRTKKITPEIVRGALRNTRDDYGVKIERFRIMLGISA